MNSRSDLPRGTLDDAAGAPPTSERSGRDAPPSAPSLAPWVALALAVIMGVVLAFRWGGRVTPLLDGLR